jgi:hypothetical protein
VGYRYRGEVTLTAPPQANGNAPQNTKLPAAQAAEVYGAITDRHSIAGLRLGVDGSRSFGVGSSTYQRTSSLSLRASAAHDISNGQGEWEAEVAYSNSKDDSAGKVCGDIVSCSGAAQSTIVSVGGNVYYRLNRDWFGVGSVFVNQTAVTHVDMTGSVDDPAVIGVTGFVRIAYRF